LIGQIFSLLSRSRPISTAKSLIKKPISRIKSGEIEEEL